MLLEVILSNLISMIKKKGIKIELKAKYHRKTLHGQ